MTFAPRPSPISKCSLPRKTKTQRMRNGEGLEPRLATCSSAVKTYTYAYHTCVKRSRVYTFIHSCGRGNGARATRRLPNVYGNVSSVPGLPRYAIYCARLIVRGRETLKTGRGRPTLAWDETSRAHRRWVDAGSRAPRCLYHNYV